MRIDTLPTCLPAALLAVLAVTAIVGCSSAPRRRPPPPYPHRYGPSPSPHPMPPAPRPMPAAPAGAAPATPHSSVAWYGNDHRNEAGLSERQRHERGHASYYAHGLAGNRTANGEVYDPNLGTAAHRTLPFGTFVDVVRDDGRWVRVRINDRGPFVTARVIDLSHRAADLIGMIDEGVVPVTLYLVK